MIWAAFSTLLLLWMTGSKLKIMGLNLTCMSHRNRAVLEGQNFPMFLTRDMV